MRISKSVFAAVIIALIVSLTTMASDVELTLEQAIEMTLESNLTIRAANEGLRAVEAGLRSTETLTKSKVDTSIKWQFEELATDGEPAWSITYQKQVWPNAITRLKVEQSQIAVEIERANLETTRQNTLYQVYKAYYQVLKDENSLMIAQETLKEAEALLKVGTAKRDSGEITETDLLLAELQKEKAQQGLSQAQAALKRNRASLALLIGVEDADYTLARPEAINREWTEGDLLAQALAHRPDYQAKSLTVQKLQQAVSLLEAERAIGVSLRGEYDYGPGEIEAAIDDQFNLRLDTAVPSIQSSTQPVNKESGWLVQATLTWGITDGGKSKADLDQATANLAGAQLNQVRAEAELALELSGVLDQINEARNRLNNAVTNLERAKLIYQAVREKYDLGAAIPSDLISAQKSLLQAEGEVFQAELDYDLKLVELRKTIGVLGEETL